MSTSQPYRTTDPTQAPRRLTRAAGGPVSGLCGGLAAYAGLDPTLVRVLVVLAALVTLPVGPLVYAVLWAVVPQQ